MMSDGGVDIVFEYVGSSIINTPSLLVFFRFIKLFMVYMYMIICIIGIIQKGLYLNIRDKINF